MLFISPSFWYLCLRVQFAALVPFQVLLLLYVSPACFCMTVSRAVPLPSFILPRRYWLITRYTAVVSPVLPPVLSTRSSSLSLACSTCACSHGYLSPSTSCFGIFLPGCVRYAVFGSSLLSLVQPFSRLGGVSFSSFWCLLSALRCLRFAFFALFVIFVVCLQARTQFVLPVWFNGFPFVHSRSSPDAAIACRAYWRFDYAYWRFLAMRIGVVWLCPSPLCSAMLLAVQLVGYSPLAFSGCSASSCTMWLRSYSCFFRLLCLLLHCLASSCAM